MPQYRWNISTHAEGYDAAAQVIHPRYVEVQDIVLAELAKLKDRPGLIVDAGGGSGRLMQRILAAHPNAQGMVVDQSEAFLALAKRRLEEFGDRAKCHVARLQEDWLASLPDRPIAVVSMTAIHHLDEAEKQTLFQRIYDAIQPGGLFINGDEVRLEDDEAYLDVLKECRTHKRKLVEDGLVPEAMHQILRDWEQRNVTNFHAPRTSGDDCHETIERQLRWLSDCGYERALCVWHEQLWAVMVGAKKA